jgi:hypothetical protein
MLLNILAIYQNALKHFKTAEYLERSKTNVFIWKKISRVLFCPLVPPSWIVQNVTPRELSQRSIPPISMGGPLLY